MAPTLVQTSLQVRTIRTANLALDVMDRLWLPVRRSWRLNERHYGDLTGKDKKQTVAEFGEAQVKLWRPAPRSQVEEAPRSRPRRRGLNPRPLGLPGRCRRPDDAAQGVPCLPGRSGTARLWFTRSKGKLTKLAVDNPCAEFLLFRHEGDRDNGYETLAAPGSHFNWGKKRIALNNASDWDGFRLWKFTDDECFADPNDTVTVVWRYNDVRPMSDAC